MPRMITTLLASVSLVMLGVLFGSAQSTDSPPSPFSSTTIDVGLVCVNPEKSLAFYKDALAFQQLPGFDAPADLLTDVGLTDKLACHVDVVALGSGPTATKLKLLSFPQAPGARVDQRFVNSSYGFRYLTAFVNDLNASLAHAEKSGVKPIGKGAAPLPKGFPEGLGLAVFRDPDGNFVELVGPYKAN